MLTYYIGKSIKCVIFLLITSDLLINICFNYDRLKQKGVIMKHLGTQTLKTQRLILRKIVNEDAPNIFKTWANDSEVTKYLTWKAHQCVKDTEAIVNIWVEAYEKDTTYRWILELKDTNQVIGMIDVVAFSQNDECATIGYVLAKPYWNQGYMSEAFKAVLDFLFNEVNVHRVEATHMITNPASGKVMEKCGLKVEGVKRLKMKNYKGVFVDLVMYGLVKQDYLKKKNDN